ncbi:hypothetical protein BVY01_02115, partial [bacterium I07]
MAKLSAARSKWAVITFLAAAAATVAVMMVLFNIRDRKMEAYQYPLKVVDISEDEIDPEIWGQNYPFEYDTFIKTEIDYGKTRYGGSTPYSKLERFPAMKRLWAGYAFSIDHHE